MDRISLKNLLAHKENILSPNEACPSAQNNSWLRD